MAKVKGVSRSGILKEALKIYISEEKSWRNIRRMGNLTAKKLGIPDENEIEKLREEFWIKGDWIKGDSNCVKCQVKFFILVIEIFNKIKNSIFEILFLLN